MSDKDIGELIALFESRFDSLSKQVEALVLLLSGRMNRLEEETDRRFQRLAAAYPRTERKSGHA